MDRRRWLWLVTIWFTLAAALMGRLFACMADPLDGAAGAGYGRLAEASGRTRSLLDAEHFQLLLTDDGRGRILYRNGQPWSGRSQPRSAVAPSGERVWVRVHRERALTVPNPVVGRIGLPERWPDPERAVPEQGRSGLEWTFDPWLRTGRPGYWGRLEDARGQTGSPTWYVRPASPGMDVRTTIDPGWQTAAERALARSGAAQSALVVVNVASGELLALASVDRVDPWRNRAVIPETPGSVFKLVTAAAALESYRFQPESRFVCEGFVPLPSVAMHCWRRHGHETLRQALAASCDVAFALIGDAVGRLGLTIMAHRLHLGETGLQCIGGHPVLPEALAGRVFLGTGADPGRLANTAIGQQDVRISPLQAANLAATVARGGIYRDVRLVLDVESRSWGRRELTVGRGQRAFSPGVAYALAEAMRDAVRQPWGTAHSLAHMPVKLAVKTGTAELSRQGRVNAWTVGFLPARRPVLAFCAFVGNEPSGPAHRQVMQLTRDLAETYRQFLGVPDIR
jgi:cell division protein FtsI/penicillin-binding protein 2